MGPDRNLGWQSRPIFVVVVVVFPKGKVSKRKAGRSHEPSLSKKHTESFLTYKLS